MNFRRFDNKRPDFERLEEIFAVLAKYEFIDIVKKTGLKNTFGRIFLQEKILLKS
jgi:hypothetical protein